MAKGKPTIKLDIKGDQELKRKLETLGARARSALMDAARAGADVIQRDANGRAPGPDIITGNERVDGGTASVDIGPDEAHWYYRFFEFGATSHEIAASKKSALAFEGRAGLIITKRVNHPGMAAAPFLRPAADQKQDQARDAAGNVFKSEIDKLVDSNVS